jgi:ubiquinone/menaquinone biosynthesis C-methylase UbiE
LFIKDFMGDKKHLIENVEKDVKPYEQFMAKKETFKQGWGNILYKDKQENMYTSEVIIHDWITQPILENVDTKNKNIKLVDFGGAAGATLLIVAKQLKLGKVECYNVDINRVALERGQKSFPEIHFVESPLSMIQIDDNSFDAGYSRFVMQYNPLVSKENSLPTQADILKEFYRVMKHGSVLVIIWPGARDNREYPAFNEFSATIQAYVSGRSVEEVLKQRSMTDTKTMGEIAQSIGFKILTTTELRTTDLSTEKYYDRFGEKMKQNGATLEGLQKLIQDSIKKYSSTLEFETIEGEQLVVASLSRLVLSK